MLIWLNGEYIVAHNTIISKEEATKYISDKCLWLEKELPILKEKTGFNVIYKYKNGEITAEYEKSPQAEKTIEEKLEENQLALMEAVADQYEEQLQNRINDMEVQATIYETLLEMQGGN